jgi:hypothetical protein
MRRSSAISAGITMDRIYALVADGLLTTVMPGWFVDSAYRDQLDPWGRFALVGRVFANAHDAYLTGWAIAVLGNLPTLGKPPHRPTVIRPKAPGLGTFTRQHGRLVVANLPAEHRIRRAGTLMTSPAWAVAEIARTSRLPDALVVADAAARRGADLGTAVPHISRWKGARKARWIAEHANGNAESALESLGRFGFYEHDFPLPVANAWVGRHGPEWRVDGLLPWHWWVKEGDGAVKYDNRSDASQIVRRQNDREFSLHRLGLDVLRYRWDDVFPNRAKLAHKIAAMFRDHPRRDEPVRWWKHVPGVGPVEPEPDDWPSPHPARIILPAGWRDDLRNR